MSSGSNRTKRLITFQPSLSSPGIIFRALYRASGASGGGGGGSCGGTSILTSNKERKKYKKHIYIYIAILN